MSKGVRVPGLGLRGTGKQVGGESGLTLLEMVVVTAILALPSAIVSLSVAGRGTESRRAVQAADEATIQSAVDRYSGEHPQGRYPTLNGCQPGRVLDLISRECVEFGRVSNPAEINTNNLEFEVEESDTGVDLNGDEDIEDRFEVAPIIWHKAFKSGLPFSLEEEEKRFLGTYVPRPPKHAFDFLRGLDDSWDGGENFDPDGLGNVAADPSRITAPSGTGPGDNRVDVVTGQVPVWVIGLFRTDSGIQVKNLLPEGRY